MELDRVLGWELKKGTNVHGFGTLQKAVIVGRYINLTNIGSTQDTVKNWAQIDWVQLLMIIVDDWLSSARSGAGHGA